MFLRFIAATGIFALGYFIGREVGRLEPIVRELERARDARMSHAGTYDHEPTVDMQDRSHDI